MQGGIWPLRSNDSRSSATTRDACVLLQVTPDQLQKWWELFFHEPRRPAGLERWSFKQRRGWKSVLDSLGRAVSPNEVAGNAKLKREQRTMVRSCEELRVPTGGIYFLSHMLYDMCFCLELCDSSQQWTCFIYRRKLSCQLLASFACKVA